MSGACKNLDFWLYWSDLGPGLNQEHTNHAEAELAQIQKVNLKGEIVKIAIIPTNLGYGQPYMAGGTNGWVLRWGSACATATVQPLLQWVGKKPVCLLVRTSIRSIPPSGDLTKLLITLCCSCPESNSTCSPPHFSYQLNRKHLLIVKLCFRYVTPFVTLCSAWEVGTKRSGSEHLCSIISDHMYASSITLLVRSVTSA